jgi:Flp pilus assembly protein TadD
VIRSLGKIDTAITMLGALLQGRSGSVALQEAYVEACLVKAKELLDRSQWGEAARLLESVRSRPGVSRPTQTALLNLLGCACCLNQEFDAGLRHLSAAAKLVSTDARVQQNLALANEFLSRPNDAEPHWNRFFDLIDQRLPAPGVKGYAESLAFEGLTRLATGGREGEVAERIQLPEALTI